MSEDRRYERTPDAIGMLLLGGVSALITLVTARHPEAVITIVGRPWPSLWAASLGLSCAISILGIAWAHPLTGRLMELAGRAGVVVTAFAYSVAFSVQGASLISTTFVIALTVTSGARVCQLGLRLRRWLVRVHAEVDGG